MKAIGRNWKAILAFLLAVAAALVIFLVYKPAKEAYETEQKNLNNHITLLQTSIAQNNRYSDIQDKLEPANEEIQASRDALYELFPVELKEEDQVLYTIYLEQQFNTEEDNASLGFSQELHDHFAETFGRDIAFYFGTAEPMQILSDGAVLEGMTITMYYHATYDGFKDMVHYLATDSRITSIRYSTFTFNEADDTISGEIVLLCYLLDSENEYQAPDVADPNTGKDNIFANGEDEA